jgi:nucleoside-diphosphate-sugar epimerase
MKTISLLGCGSLGFPLAIQLLQKGYCVKGSTTAPAKLQELKKAGIIPYLIQLDKEMPADFFVADILVLTLPYKRSFSDPKIYKNQIQIISEKVRVSSIKHIVFTSSSSVYPKDGKIYSTSDEFEPANLRAKILLECEQILNNLNNISTITIRLGGIYHGSLIKQSKTPRRLVSHKEALKHIEHGINRLGENDCVNGFNIS